MQKLSIELELLLKDAVSSLKSFSSTTKTQLTEVNTVAKTLSSSFDFLAAGAVAAIGGFSLKHIVSEGIEAQDAIDKLTGSLRFLGDETPVEKFEALAQEITSLTGINDKLVLSQITLLKTLGATNKQVDSVIRTASELSTVLGQDLGTSVNDLVQSFSGTLPRSLSKFIPELKNLTKEQLASGEAVRLLQEKLSGLSEQMRNTTGVQVKILKEEFSNSVEELGKLIINSDSFRWILNDVTSSIKNLNYIIKETPKFFNGLYVEFLKVDKTVSEFINKIPVIKDVFKSIGASGSGIDKRITEIESINKNVENTSESLKDSKDNAKGLGFQIKEINKEVQQFLSQIGTPSFKKLAVIEESKNQLKKANELLKDNLISRQQFAQAEIEIERSKSEKIQQINKESFASIADLYKNRAELEKLPAIERIVSISFGVAADIGKGFQGALDLTKKLTSTVVETLLPSFGSIVGELVGFLAQSPDQLKATLKAFFDAFPQIISNIIENIPNLLVGLAENVDSLAEKLPETIDKAIRNFVDRSPEFISALAGKSDIIATRFAIAMAAQAPTIAQSVTTEFIKNIPLIATETGKAIAKSVTDAVGSVGNILGVGGGGGGILGSVTGAIGSVGDFFGFADGGVVGGGAPYVDRIPAMLTPKEEVVSRKDLSRVDKLISILESKNNSASQPQNQNLTINLTVGQEQLASVLLSLNDAGFRVER